MACHQIPDNRCGVSVFVSENGSSEGEVLYQAMNSSTSDIKDALLFETVGWLPPNAQPPERRRAFGWCDEIATAISQMASNFPCFTPPNPKNSYAGIHWKKRLERNQVAVYLT